MNSRSSLLTIFTTILLTMLALTLWASHEQPVWEWTGLKQEPNHAWTIATLCDAYFGFLTFYMWVHYKERSVAKRLLWFVAIMALGNMAMAGYVLKELLKLDAEDPMSQVLTRRN